MGLMLGLEIDIPAREFAERALREGVLVTTAKQKIPSSARAEYPHGAVENCRPGTGALRG